MACLKPYKLKTGEEAPCGKCPSCYKTRALQWGFRLMQEEKQCTSSYFVTLTYDNNNVPISKRGFLTLNFRDVQLFVKRLRKLESNQTSGKGNGNKSNIKYYAVGEYGTSKKRPHYHLIIYNASIKLIEQAWCIEGKKIGEIYYGKVQEASVMYTLKYMSKVGQIPQFKNDDRTKEKALMSKGMGLNYLTPQMIIWHRSDLLNRMYCSVRTTMGTFKIAMPRIYKSRIYKWYELNMINENVSNKRREEDLLKLAYGEVKTEKQYLQSVEQEFRRMIIRHKIKRNANI